MAIEKLDRLNANARKYRVTVRVGGKRLSKTFRSLQEATQRERSFLTARDQGAVDDLAEKLSKAGDDNKIITVGELFHLWFETHAKTALTASSRIRDESIFRTYIRNKFGDFPAQLMTPRDVEGWLTDLRLNHELSVGSVNRCRQILHKIYRFGFERELLEKNPVAKIRPLKGDKNPFAAPERYLTESDGKRFLQHFKEVDKGVYPLFLVLLRTGLRLGEMLALRAQDFKVDGRFPHLYVGRLYDKHDDKFVDRTKGKKARVVPLDNECVEVLRMCIQGKSSNDPLLFADWQTPRWANKVVRRHLTSACKKLQIPYLRIHNLRHSFCTIFLEKGGSLRLCQSIAGHSTVQVTERYAHISQDYLAQAGAILNR